ncbi:Universal stress protein [Zostera marina]|uniref:Universal stress protein n=1 Tax=Zostera marina TaxID=29655 RepID=A0A0K9PBV1_ZOSMR|nr:Universal stress protein [Zostera marina]
MAAETVMVVGMDESEHSQYAFHWTIEHFFSNSNSSSIFKLVVVHAKPSPTSSFALAGPGAIDVIPYIDFDLKKTASRIIEHAKTFCENKSVDNVHFEIVEGDPRSVLCDSVERHKADMLIVGSHGYGTFKRAVLGSVSDYCAHHAHCSVMIVKKPKSNH